MSNDRRWYVVHTQPNRETRAALNLKRQGFNAYLPMFKRLRRHARKTEEVSRPLFPRYMFVELDLSLERWRSIYSTFGVSHMLTAGEDPVAVPAGIVDEIRAREGSDGFVELGLPPGIGPGSPVRLIDGIFAEAKGVLDRIADQYRVSVLLQLLGREVRVFVPAAYVGAA
jgi:transcriptional antiterminator RfaH